MAHSSKRAPRAEANVQIRRAFARGDFATVRRLAPQFVAPSADGGQASVALFAPGRLVPASAWGSGLLLILAWTYALLQR